MSRLHHCKSPNFCVSVRPSSMEVSFLQHCSRTCIISSRPLAPHTRSIRCSLNRKFPPPSAAKNKVPIPARDRIINFGKHKGQRLGALPSNYLQWMYKNYVVWPELAKEVLNDPVYRDRIEWEYVEKLLHGPTDYGGPAGRLIAREQHQSDDVVADIKEIADKFDWDMEDRRGWAKVKLDLLGTSFSGPIPRKNDGEKAWWSTKLKDEKEEEEAAMLGGRRRERRQRRILKSDRELGLGLKTRDEDRVMVKRDLGATEEEEEEEKEEEEELRSDGDGKSQQPTVHKGIRFPGRESLFEKVKMINNRKRSS